MSVFTVFNITKHDVHAEKDKLLLRNAELSQSIKSAVQSSNEEVSELQQQLHDRAQQVATLETQLQGLIHQLAVQSGQVRLGCMFPTRLVCC